MVIDLLIGLIIFSIPIFAVLALLLPDTAVYIIKYLQVHFISTPLMTKLIIFAIAFLYIYYCIYKWKQNTKWKKTFKNLTIYFISIAVFYYTSKYAVPNIHSTLFANPLLAGVSKYLKLNLIFAYISSGLALIALFLFIRNHALNTPIKGLKHGPRFTTRAKSQDGIVVGRYDTDVLPKHIQQFVPYSTAPVIIPYNLLSRGVTVLGSMGCGKSRLMQLIHDGISERYPHIPILINDPKGEWLRTYYNPETDLIFAPHDSRSCGWKLWDDFANRPELRHSMISTAVQSHASRHNADVFWTDSAIMLLQDVISGTTPEQARDILLSRRDARHEDKTFMSIYATTLLGFRDMIKIELGAANNSKSYTMQELLNWRGRIFLLNSPACSQEQQGALTLFLSAFLMEALNRPDAATGELRATAMIDEALFFNLPPMVETAIFTQSRSKGLAIIAGAQRLPNVRYGERGEWSVQAGHLFGMRTGDLDTREALSQRLGRIIYDEEQHSHTSGQESTSTTTTKVRRDHPAVAPADFGALRNREFVLFHEHGIAVGTTTDVAGEQNDIDVFDYDPRDDVHEFLRVLL